MASKGNSNKALTVSAMVAMLMSVAPAQAGNSGFADFVSKLSGTVEQELRERGKAAQRRIAAPRSAYIRDLAARADVAKLDAKGQQGLMRRGIGPRTEAEMLKRLDMKQANTAKLTQAGRKAQQARAARKAAKAAKAVKTGVKAAKYARNGALIAATGGTAAIGIVALEGAKKASGVDIPVFESAVGGVIGTVGAIKNKENVGAVWKGQGRRIAKSTKTSLSRLKQRGCAIGNLFRSKSKDKKCR